MVKINKDIIIDGTNKTLGDLANSSSNNYLPITGGTLTGNLTIKGSDNYGTKINLGDGDYVHLYEIEDDVLEIKASEIRLNTSKLVFNVDDFENKVTFYDSPAHASFKKVGNIVIISFQGSGISHKSGDTIFKMPSEYAPQDENQYWGTFVVNAIGYGTFYITPDGNCVVGAVSTTSAGRIYLQCAYIIK